MYFPSLVNHANLSVYHFTIDAHSQVGHRGRATPPLGEPIHQPDDIAMYATSTAYDGALSDQRLRTFLKNAVDSL